MSKVRPKATRQKRDVVELIQRELKRFRIKHEVVSLTNLRVFDLERGQPPVKFLSYRGQPPFCIILDAEVGRLLGNAPLREIPMRFSCFRVAGASILPILRNGTGGIRILYFDERPALIVDAELLLRRIKKVR